MKQRSLLPLRLAARRLGVKASSLRAAAGQGHVPAVSVGDELLFDLCDVKRALFARVSRAGRKEAHRGK
jgi:hypothetical protein